MSPEIRELMKQIEELTEQEQETVRKFIGYLKQAKTSAFLDAVDKFIEKHPELLRRLARTYYPSLEEVILAHQFTSMNLAVPADWPPHQSCSLPAG